MKKETSIAVVLGIVFGLVLSFVMITKTKNNEMAKTKTLSNEKKKTVATINQSTSQQSFVITEPQDRTITGKSSIAIKGTAEKDALVIIQSPIKDAVQKNEKGSFSVDFPLALGENIIQVSVYSKDAQTRVQQKELRIYYLDE